MKLLMLQGLPCAGKSTRAAEIVAQGNWVRLNRDLLRTMLHFDKFSNTNEGLTVVVEKALARSLLVDSNVVIDDCDLNPKNKEMWKTIAKECGASFETELVGKDLPIDELILRDSKRGKSVGASVIKNMALQYGLVPKEDKGYCLIDIDGTIANCEHRRHFVQQNPKDWKGFFGEMDKDTLIEKTAEIVRNYHKEGHPIIYVSARPEDYRDVTLKWLNDNNMNFAWTLIMRPKHDTRPDTEIKQEIYDKYLKKYPIEVTIDDRPSILRVWKSNGLKVIDAGNGEEF